MSVSNTVKNLVEKNQSWKSWIKRYIIGKNTLDFALGIVSIALSYWVNKYEDTPTFIFYSFLSYITGRYYIYYFIIRYIIGI